MQIHYSKNSFCLAKQIRDRIKIAQERTSFWPTARRACARRAERISPHKINGRHFVPPTIWLSKSRKVLSWCIYTTTLEPILAKMSDADEHLRAPPKAGLRLKQNFHSDFFFRRADCAKTRRQNSAGTISQSYCCTSFCDWSKVNGVIVIQYTKVENR